MNQFILYHTIFLCIILLSFTACKDSSHNNSQKLLDKPVHATEKLEAKQAKAIKESSPEKKEPSITLEGDDIILARVNDTTISQYDLDQSIQDMFDPETIRKIDKKEQNKILESLVKSRAIAHAFEKIMTPEDRAVVDKKVKSYREQLLVKMYLVRKTNPEPVTLKMVKDYYDAHPEKFGGKTIRVYEMIGSQKKITSSERDSFITVLKNADNHQNWKKWVQDLQQKQYSVFYRSGESLEFLHKKLQEIIKSLKKDKPSQMAFVQDRLYLIRIASERNEPPRPLEEVSVEIRKSLVPMQLKKSIQKASQQIMEKTSISRIYNHQQN